MVYVYDVLVYRISNIPLGLAFSIKAQCIIAVGVHTWQSVHPKWMQPNKRRIDENVELVSSTCNRSFPKIIRLLY